MLITLVPVIVGGVIGLAGGFGPIAKMDQSENLCHKMRNISFEFPFIFMNEIGT